MARQWIRLYANAWRNPKIQRLPDHLFRFLVNCWCFCADTDTETLPKSEDLAWQFKIEPTVCAAYVDHLVELKLLEWRPEGTLVPHDWDELQRISEKTSTQRVRRFRDKSKLHETGGNGFVPFPKPFPSESVSESASESVSTEKSVRETKTARLPKGYVLDEQYKNFREACIAFGMAVIESDFTGPAWHEWCALDPEQRQAAIAGITTRQEARADPQMVPRPQKYLINREWTRAINGARRQETAIERAIREA